MSPEWRSHKVPEVTHWVPGRKGKKKTSFFLKCFLFHLFLKVGVMHLCWPESPFYFRAIFMWVRVYKTVILFSSAVAFKENVAIIEHSLPCNLYFLCLGKSKGASFQIAMHLHHRHLSLPDFSVYIHRLVVESRNNMSFISKSAFVVYSSVFPWFPSFIVVYR